MHLKTFKYLSIIICLKALAINSSAKELLCSSNNSSIQNAYYKLITNKVKLAYLKADIKIKLIPTPGARIVEKLKSEEFDCVIGRVSNYMEVFGLEKIYIPIPVSIASVKFNVYTKKNYTKKKTQKIAYIRGQAAPKSEAKKFKKAFEVESYKQLIKMLDVGRVDGIIGADIEIEPFFKNRKNYKVFSQFPAPLIYTFIHKRHKLKMPKIEKSFKSVFSKPVTIDSFNFENHVLD